MFEKITAGATRIAAKVGAGVAGKSPELLVAAGIGLGIACVITACKKSRTVDEEVVDEFASDLEKVHEEVEKGELKGAAKARKLICTYVKGLVRAIKHYWLPITLGLLSIGCTLAGFHIIKGRYVALAAAYTGLSQNYDAMVDRVREKYGDEVADELQYGLKKEEYSETRTDEETGAEVTEFGNKEFTTLYEDARYMVLDFDFHPGINSETYAENTIKVTFDQQNNRYQAGYDVTVNDIRRDFSKEAIGSGCITGWAQKNKKFNKAGAITYKARKLNTDGLVYLVEMNIDKSPIWDKMPKNEPVMDIK